MNRSSGFFVCGRETRALPLSNVISVVTVLLSAVISAFSTETLGDKDYLALPMRSRKQPERLSHVYKVI